MPLQPLPVAGVLLAAGRSTRMGRPKQLADLNGQPLCLYAARALAGVYSPLLAVIPPGEVGEGIRVALSGLPFTFAANPQPELGLASSFRAAAEHLPAGLGGAVFALADMPLVTADLHAQLLSAFRETNAPVVMAAYGEGEAAVRAPPHLLRADLLPELPGLPDADHGPRRIIAAHHQASVTLNFPAALLLDVDTPDGLEEAETALKERGPMVAPPAPRYPEGLMSEAAPQPERQPETLILEIEKLVAGGLGLARDEDGVVLARGALPGERVRATVRAGRGVRQAVTVEVLEASPDRVDGPNLPTADLGHASYAAQLRYKRDFVQEALTRIAKLKHEVNETVPSPSEWHYRNTAQYLVTPDGLAYRERRGNDPLVVAEDPLVMEAISAIVARIDPTQLAPATEIAFRASALTGEVVAALIGAGEPRAFQRASEHLMEAGAVGVSLAQPAGRRFSAGVRLIAGEADVREQFGRVQVSVSATGFAQVNPAAAGLAYERAAELAGKGEHAVDLYGGAGAIGRHLAPNFRRVTVLDASPEALARGRQDVAESVEAGRPEGNVTYVGGDAARFSELGTDVIVVDPPRAGLEEGARVHIDSSTADRLVYISCDPATWARDVGDLVRRGWKLGAVTPHDFYPQTSHIEIVSVLNR